MFGIILAGASDLFEEVSESIAKNEAAHKVASVYTLGFLTALAGTAFFVIEGLVFGHLVFRLASLPTFLPRLALEVLQAHVTIRAITIVPRGDYGLVRAFTIPLLLMVDVALGYPITLEQVAGMGIIIAAVGAVIFIEGRALRGFWFLAISTVNAAVTISLYKYNIAHFNSVEAEQAIVGAVLMAYFFALALYRARENPLRFLSRPIFAGQTAASGLASVAISFAYFFAPASIVMTAQRSFAILFAILAGKFYFLERHFLVRLLFLVILVAGLLLIALR